MIKNNIIILATLTLLTSCASKEPATIASISDKQIKINKRSSQQVKPENVIQQYRDFLKNAPVEERSLEATKQIR